MCANRRVHSNVYVCCRNVVFAQELWEQQKALEEQQRELREKERLESLKKKEKHEQSAVASSEVKQKLQVGPLNILIVLFPGAHCLLEQGGTFHPT